MPICLFLLGLPLYGKLVLFFGGHVPFFFFFFWPCLLACRCLVSPAGIEPVPPAVEVWYLSHWTAGEVLGGDVRTLGPVSFFCWCPSTCLPTVACLVYILFGDLSELQVGERSRRKPGRTGFCPWGRGWRRLTVSSSQPASFRKHLLPDLLKSLIPMNKNEIFGITVN